MNARLQELESQCWEAKPYGPPWFDSKKFAELIVEECFKAAMIESKGHMNPIDLMKRMKEQVGVEECNHEWVSVKNPVVLNGSICVKCGALDTREPEELR
jgi:hypothetical protein